MFGSANVADFLLEGKPADGVALRMLQGDYSYGELRAAATQAAAALLRIQPPGARVLLIADNSPFWVAAYLGTILAGQVCVPLPVTISREDLAYVAGSTGAGAAFVQAKVLRSHSKELAGLHVVTDAGGPRQALDADVDLPPVQAGDLAAVMFTSGSTGRPRGVMVTHRNIRANTESIIRYLALSPADRIMTVLPFHYCFGASLLHTHLRVGASLVIDHRFLYPETIVQRMAETACTGFAGVPSHFQILLRQSRLKNRRFPHLRYVQQAGGHLAPGFVRELREALPQTQVFLMYGQTEGTSRLSYLPPEFLDSKSGSIGKGIPGVKLRVWNEAGEPVAPGEVGEIVAEGENVTLGYWGAPEESAQTFREGKLFTGDLATVDEDGFVYVVDRSRDFLKCGGVRVSSRQIEDQLLECGGVLEAAVVGVPDDVLGEAVKAFIVLSEPSCSGACSWPDCQCAVERFTRFCREHLPHKLVPKEVVLVPALPRNSAGKVLKANLKALL